MDFYQMLISDEPIDGLWLWLIIALPLALILSIVFKGVNDETADN